MGTGNIDATNPGMRQCLASIQERLPCALSRPCHWQIFGGIAAAAVACRGVSTHPARGAQWASHCGGYRHASARAWHKVCALSCRMVHPCGMGGRMALLRYVLGTTLTYRDKLKRVTQWIRRSLRECGRFCVIPCMRNHHFSVGHNCALCVCVWVIESRRLLMQQRHGCVR